MKKLLSIILAVCVISTLLVMPVSAEVVVAPLDLSNAPVIQHSPHSGARANTANPITEFVDYPVSKLFDGDTNSTAILNLDGTATNKNGKVFLYSELVIDLGAEYTVSSVDFVRPSSAQVSAIASEFSAYANEPTSQQNASMGIMILYKENPTTTTPSTSYVVINPNGADNKFHQATFVNNKTTYTIPDNGNTYRYVKFWAGQDNNANTLMLNELTINVETTVIEPEPIEASFTSDVAFGEVDGVETLRFYFTPSFEDEITDFGAYIVPLDFLSDKLERETVYGNKAIESGKTFAADLIGIPEAAYDEPIVAVPFVVSTDGLYTYGAGVETTVNANK